MDIEHDPKIGWIEPLTEWLYRPDGTRERRVRDRETGKLYLEIQESVCGWKMQTQK